MDETRVDILAAIRALPDDKNEAVLLALIDAVGSDDVRIWITELELYGAYMFRKTWNL